MKRSLVLTTACVLATLGGVSTAHADTQSVPCTDHNRQAVLSTTNAFFLCFEGTGNSYDSRIGGVVSVSSGPYTVSIGQYGAEDPIIVPPGTTKRLDGPLDIDFVQLF
ncbi:hypothetical protein [Streptomyces sp. TLI_185]|uniref:hypothetical protein n=1 Tax=Streptomyces sp. TLI_185 TaxID=2485151 RepID=UPI000F4EEA10|nr:hypothetical protein [Streptomyces sp. TLI_185]RPF39198.1 hypothetical protein EDD92_9419 [Streptomyces sp. TLI_185]